MTTHAFQSASAHLRSLTHDVANTYKKNNNVTACFTITKKIATVCFLVGDIFLRTMFPPSNPVFFYKSWDGTFGVRDWNGKRTFRV